MISTRYANFHVSTDIPAELKHTLLQIGHKYQILNVAVAYFAGRNCVSVVSYFLKTDRSPKKTGLLKRPVHRRNDHKYVSISKSIDIYMYTCQSKSVPLRFLEEAIEPSRFG